jgi:guanylate kinase
MEGDAFDRAVASRQFLEWAEVHEHRYGTLRDPVMRTLGEGRDVLFDIDWQGAAAVAADAPGDTVRVFILPPTMTDLGRRLRSRAQDSESVIRRRLERAEDEIAKWMEYDYVIVNDDFDRASAELAAIYGAERLRRDRNLWLGSFVDSLVGAR